MSFLDKAKSFGRDVGSATKKAADATQRKARRGKLAAEIAVAERAVRSHKRDFGVAAWDKAAAGEDISAAVEEFRVKIDACLASIEAKRAEIAALKEGQPTRPSDARQFAADDDGGVVI